jgi:hypothetical protein
MKSLVIRAEVVGRRGMSFAPLRLERSFPFQTARDLLCTVVEQQVEEYRLRKQDVQLLRVLSVEAIEDRRSTGKIVSGGQDQDARVPAVPDAIRTAIQAFEDGLFYMFVNDAQVEHLDQPISDQESMDLLFLRLTPLVGG